MNRREFLQSAGLLGLSLTSPISIANSASKNVKENSSLENQISYLRNLAKDTPNSNLLKDHWENIVADYNSDLNDAQRNFRISKARELLPIIGIEHGKPYLGYPSGFDVESPTGCKGLAQFSFPGFYDACSWFSRIENKREIDSNLSHFTPFLADKEKMKEVFNEMFKSANFKINGTILSSAETQIDALASYFNKLTSHLNSSPLAFYSYNIGLESTVKLIAKEIEVKQGEVVKLSKSPGVYDFDRIRKLVQLYNITPQSLMATPLGPSISNLI